MQVTRPSVLVPLKLVAKLKLGGEQGCAFNNARL